MVSKQDKQAARTAADLERRYGTRFSEIMGVAEEAKDTAERAEEAAEEAKQSFEGLDQAAIFKLLTNDGAAEGMFLDDKGQIYINASYLAAGIIASANGSVKLDLLKNKLEISIDPLDGYSQWRKMVFNAQGIGGYSEGYDADGTMYQTLQIIPGVVDEGWPDFDPSLPMRYGFRTKIFSIDSDLQLMTSRSQQAHYDYALRLGYDASSKIVINRKVVSWKDNGDGTYTLIGTDEEVLDE